MASNYNNQSKNIAPVGEGDPADLKLVIGVGVFIVLCFLVGYFVIGKNFGNASNNATSPEPVGVSTTIVPNGTQPTSSGKLTVVDNTAAIEAKRKKAEAEAKKKADEEAKQKAEEEAKKLAAQEAAENTASPTPAATTSAPDPDDLPQNGEAVVPVPAPDPEDPGTIPAPTPEATPTPKPSPSPSPVSNTPDDPEDRAMATGQPTTAVTGPLYRVRVGTFDEKANAEARAAELKSAGYETSLSTDVMDGRVIYRLQVAAYKSEKSAREFAKQVEAKGFKTTIAHN